MKIGEHLRSFAGKPVVDFPHDCLRHSDPTGEDFLSDPASVAWRIRCPVDCYDVRDTFMDTVDTAQVTHLVIGNKSWIKTAEDAPRLPALRALFINDIVWHENEFSWIYGEDAGPLLEAFPHLEHLGIRGTKEMKLGPLQSGTLKTLRFESAGMPAAAVRALGDSDLPALESLTLWLGLAQFGGDGTVGDLEGILGGERLPSLRHLGLEDSEIQDEIAAAVAGAPVVARLTSLSLAMGALSDRGAEALLSGQPLKHLDDLDLHHHFLSEPMMERVRSALPGVQVNLEERQEPRGEMGFYVAVGE